jgi:hypothetical protein
LTREVVAAYLVSDTVYAVIAMKSPAKVGRRERQLDTEAGRGAKRIERDKR